MYKPGGNLACNFIKGAFKLLLCFFKLVSNVNDLGAMGFALAALYAVGGGG